MKTLDIKTDSDGIALITIDLKDRSMNVVSPEFIVEFDQAVDQVAGDENIRGAVVTSGKSSFIAGADLLQIVDEIVPGGDPKAAFVKWSGLQQLYRKLETCGKPVVAAINGTALGGGLELCLACHHRVAADNPKAKLGQPEVQVGLLPGAGGTQRLPRLIGLEAALPLLLQGTHLSPGKAAELGVVDLLVSPGQEVDAAKKWILDGGEAIQPWDKKGFKVPGGAGLMNPKAIQTQMFGVALLQKTTNHNYPAPIAIMSAVYEGSVLPIDTALQIESKYFAEMLTNVVARNMIRTLFVSKGAADKLVRRPQGVDRSKVTKLGVLGAGMMGAGIAFVSARAGLQVVLLDRSKDDAEKGKDYSRKLLQKRVDRGRMNADAAAEVLELIHTTDDYADLDGCEYVIEAVFEDRGVKADVTAKTEAVIGSDAIFGSNTSTLPITGLAKASKRAESFIGIHFFSPVDKMPLVEVIVGEKTSDTAIARTLDYIQQIRKTPIVVNDSRGFYTSRVFSTFTREGIAMLAEGVNPALIENVAKHAGMPVGPLAVTDEVSLELAYTIGKQTKADLGDDYVVTPADDVMETMVVELERRGKRFGAGFYEYADDGSKRLWPGLAKHFPLSTEQPSPEEVKTRLLYVQALDAARCLEEGVLTHPADADVGSVFGWGFPPYTGGTLSYIETVGLKAFVAEADRLAKTYGARFQVPDGLRGMAESGNTYYGLAGKGEARTAA
ncbi:MAG: 3-hydroxyacyl-CoA dehydrogenase NAD-binding domain-containing protein [Gammaproteobacteria bacterium]|nr:3-hydroxyacyl-CoA dehydrogenase NAD-binding domain-containing protein [Gammaproteobacteria bacterium]MDH3480304.1 3-hydroxyacyl-CoA dehydrogenase NAD-binding domain-containing protein [Gammaproteobacteria bacterium]